MAALFTDPIYRRFVCQRPIAVAAQLVLRRLLDRSALDALFLEHAQSQSERTLLFSSLTHLMSAVVLGQQASVNAAYEKMKDELLVSKTAVYEKLQRIEPQTVRELVRYSYQRVVEVRREFGGVPQHELAGYDERILDGNHFSGTEHRLKETRSQTAAPLPGKALVVFDPRRGAVCDIVPIEDGHAQERSALDDIIETLRAQQLWIADRNFCTLKFLYAIAAHRATFVIRQHQQLHGTERGRLRKIGRTETGEVFENQLELPTFEGQTLTVRRVVVRLFQATRDGDTEVVLLTNLPADNADACAVSERYLGRWRIEKTFNHLTLAYQCEIKPLCYPRAALFCFANALVAYNAVSILNAAIAHEHSREDAAMLSHFAMTREILETTDGLLVALPNERWSEVATMPLEDFASELLTIARNICLRTYRKSIRGPKKTAPNKSHNKRHVHVSTKKILYQRRKT